MCNIEMIKKFVNIPSLKLSNCHRNIIGLCSYVFMNIPSLCSDTTMMRRGWWGYYSHSILPAWYLLMMQKQGRGEGREKVWSYDHRLLGWVSVSDPQPTNCTHSRHLHRGLNNTIPISCMLHVQIFLWMFHCIAFRHNVTTYPFLRLKLLPQ